MTYVTPKLKLKYRLGKSQNRAKKKTGGNSVTPGTGRFVIPPRPPHQAFDTAAYQALYWPRREA